MGNDLSSKQFKIAQIWAPISKSPNAILIHWATFFPTGWGSRNPSGRSVQPRSASVVVRRILHLFRTEKPDGKTGRPVLALLPQRQEVQRRFQKRKTRRVSPVGASNRGPSDPTTFHNHWAFWWRGIEGDTCDHQHKLSLEFRNSVACSCLKIIGIPLAIRPLGDNNKLVRSGPYQDLNHKNWTNELA